MDHREKKNVKINTLTDLPPIPTFSPALLKHLELQLVPDLEGPTGKVPYWLVVNMH